MRDFFFNRGNKKYAEFYPLLAFDDKIDKRKRVYRIKNGIHWGVYGIRTVAAC